MKPPPCVVDRWAGGSLTRRPKGPFAVSWPRQLGEIKCNYKLQKKKKIKLFKFVDAVVCAVATATYAG